METNELLMRIMDAGWSLAFSFDVELRELQVLAIMKNKSLPPWSCSIPEIELRFAKFDLINFALEKLLRETSALKEHPYEHQIAKSNIYTGNL